MNSGGHESSSHGVNAGAKGPGSDLSQQSQSQQSPSHEKPSHENAAQSGSAAEEKFMSLLSVRQLSLAYAGKQVVHDLSFTLARGEIACLLGPSGCGKTSVLRALAGFEAPASGSITLNGEQVADAREQRPAHLRRIGMVFQDHALFPHLRVIDNIAFGLSQFSANARRQRVDEMLTLTGLSELATRYPHQLSGGQQQRVALARALAPRPHLLLMDEPFANLDAELRAQLAQDIRQLLKAQQLSAILVTHDQHEAFAMADNVGVMRNGVLLQWSTPYQLYHEPANRAVADFIGEGVFLRGRVVDARGVEMELGCLPGAVPPDCCIGCEVDVLLRPDDIVHDDASHLTAIVRQKAFRGAEFLYTLELASGAQVLSLVPSHHNHAIGEAIGIRLELDHAIVYPRVSVS